MTAMLSLALLYQKRKSLSPAVLAFLCPAQCQHPGLSVRALRALRACQRPVLLTLPAAFK